MTLETRNSNLKGGQSSGTKSAALVLIGMVLLTLVAAHPLSAQEASAPAAGSSAQGGSSAIPPDVAKQIEALTKRVEQLELQLKQHEASEQPETVVPSAKATAPVRMQVVPAAEVVQTEAAAAGTAKPAKIVPFSDWDWTWLNGNPRNKDTAFDSKFFTPEIRADVTYNYDFNRPIDNSMGGSSELFRTNEIQLEQLGLGGDFHYDNVRARFMTQFGMYSTTTVRNDPSYAKGQWNLNEAHRDLAEAYGGYHIDALDGVNIDAGIFLSYIGLFSYYNFDNWAYQPSYVSSNTPWFFEGLRVQIFPTPHLKIEPWLINGWQSYASANSRKGLGGQIKWTPRPWVNIISNNYGLGHDDLYVPNRGRIHTDDSIEIKYFDKPGQTIDKMALSFTGDMGCEFGPSTVTASGTYLQGVGCHGNTRDAKSVGGDHFGPGINPKQSFIGYMLYDRTWFKKDRYGLTIGGGEINNPGRYLVLIPPINGETAPSAAINSPYFSGNPSDPFKAWDTSITYDYMPKQWITFRWEYDYRHASVPYWTGRGGITPPGPGGVPYTNNGYPEYFACNNGNSSMAFSLSAAQTACGSQGSSVWFPDLRRDEHFVDIDIMVKF
ncbi:MAG: outer membrane beta-barrel protein [Terriglobales bacterium]